jgi:hypothetical protein
MDTWKTVGVGDVVQDKNGTTWTVTNIDRSTAVVAVADLKAQSGRTAQVRVPSGKEVTVLYSKARARRTADMLAVRLGGRLIAEPGEGGKGYDCPTDYLEMGTMLAHLYIFHAWLPKDDPEADPFVKHVELHRPENKDRAYVEHRHTPDFGK